MRTTLGSTTLLLFLYLLLSDFGRLELVEGAVFRLGFPTFSNATTSRPLPALQAVAGVEAGLRAGIKQVNEQGLAGEGNTIQLYTREMADEPEAFVTSQGTNITRELLDIDGVEGLTSGPFGSTTIRSEAIARDKMILNSQQVDNFADNPSSNAVFWRLDVQSEIIQLLNFAVASRLKCTSAGVVFFLEDLQKNFVGFKDTLAESGIYEVETAVIGDEIAQGNTTRALPFIIKLQNFQPRCVVMFAPPPIVIGFMVAAQGFLSFFDEMAFIVPSLVSLPQYEFQGSSALFQNLYIISSYPHHQDTGKQFVVEYQSALSALKSSGELNTTVMKSFDNPVNGSFVLSPSTYSMEGYASIRLLAEAMRRAKTVDAAGVLEAVFTTQLFTIADITLGPYRKECVGFQAIEFKEKGIPCFCNRGTKQLYTYGVGSDGFTFPVLDDLSRGEFGVATLNLGANECAPTFAAIQRNRLFGLTSGLGGGANDYGNHVAESFIQIRKATPQGVGRLELINISTTAELSRFKPVGLIGERLVVAGSGSDAQTRQQPTGSNTGTLGGSILLGEDPSSMALADPSTWSREGVSFDPVLADYIHAAAFYLSRNGGGSVKIIAMSSEAATLVEKSLITFGLSSGGATIITGSAEAAGAATSISGDTIFVSNDRDSTAAFLIGALLTSSGNPRVVFAVPEVTFYTIGTALPAGSAVHPSFYFASVMTQWWGSANASTADSNLVSNWRSSHDKNSTTYPTAIELRAHRTATLAREVVTKMNAFTPEDFLTTIYSLGTISTLGQSLGSFSDNSCTSAEEAQKPSRTCQCNKGPRATYVHSLNDMLQGQEQSTSSGTNNFLSTIACGVEYIPLPEEKSMLPTILGSVFGVLAFLILVGVALFIARKPTRDNSNAPTDSDKPLVLAFTDVQSSTSLWAKVPEAMSVCIEIHHEILRECIAKHNGYEVKTIGDSFMVAFKDPKSALNFSVDVQKNLHANTWGGEAAVINETYQELEIEKKIQEQEFSAATTSGQDSSAGNLSISGASGGLMMSNNNNNYLLSPSTAEITTTQQGVGNINIVSSDDTALWNGIRVRIGLHFGQGSIQLDPVSQGYDYYGTVVNTAARVESVGNGGQVLMTDSLFYELSKGAKDLPSEFGVTSKDMGMVPLKGLPAPVQLFQVTHRQFAGRLYADLRVDRGDDDDAGYGGGGSLGSGASSQGSRVSVSQMDSADKIADHYSKKATLYGANIALQNMQTTHSIFKGVISLAKPEQRHKFLEHLATRWRLASVSNNPGVIKKNTDRVSMELVCKASLVYEEKVKKERIKNGDQVMPLENSSRSAAHSSTQSGSRRASRSSPGQKVLSPQHINAKSPPTTTDFSVPALLEQHDGESSTPTK